MLSPRGSLSARRAAGGLAGIIAPLLALAALGCGVPITQAEIAATAEKINEAVDVNVMTQQVSSAVPVEVSPTPSDGARSLVLAATPGASPTMTPTGATATPAGATVTPPPGATVQVTIVSAFGTATPTPALSATPTLTATQTPAPTSADLATQAVKLINDRRLARGLNPLSINASITTAAAGYAKLMAERNWFGHDGPDGSSPQSRLTAAGYPGHFKGEAIAAGQSTAQSAVEAWVNSPAHAAILFEPTAVEIGIGTFTRAGSAYGSYWVLATGIP